MSLYCTVLYHMYYFLNGMLADLYGWLVNGPSTKERDGRELEAASFPRFYSSLFFFVVFDTSLSSLQRTLASILY